MQHGELSVYTPDNHAPARFCPPPGNSSILDEALEFLRHVLPPEGRYALFIKGARRPNRYFDTIEDLAEAMFALKGEDVSFLAATVLPGAATRKAADIYQLKALRADVDYGDGKPYATKEAALLAIVKVAVAGLKLPRPIIVHTGHGFHVWFPLEDAVSVGEWQPLADGLRQLLIGGGLQLLSADAEHIVQSARLGRCPGCWNCKGKATGAAPVQVSFAANWREFEFLNASAMKRLREAASLVTARRMKRKITSAAGMPAKMYSRSVYGEAIKQILADLPVRYADDYAEWIRIGMILRETGWEDALDIWDEFSKRSDKYDALVLKAKWESFQPPGDGNGVDRLTVASLLHTADNEGIHYVLEEGEETKFPDEFSNEPLGVEGLDAPCISANSDFNYNKNGTIQASDRNVALAILKLGVIVRTNEFTRCIDIEHPFTEGFYGKLEKRPSIEKAAQFLTLTIACKYGINVNAIICERAIEALAARNSYNPVVSRILGEKWDGVCRADRWLIDYCGVENTLYNRAAGRLLLMSIVKRVLYPGCKCDNMFILTGKEGIGKTTLVRLLGFDDYSSTAILRIDDPRKVVEMTIGKMVVEIPEVEKWYNNYREEEIKAFITMQDDDARLVYKKEAARWKRTYVIIGTTNDATQLISDMNGARRYIFISCPNHFKLDELKEIITQLYAEVVPYVDETTVLTLPKEAEQTAAEERMKYSRTSEFFDALQQLLLNRDVNPFVPVNGGAQFYTANDLIKKDKYGREYMKSFEPKLLLGLRTDIKMNRASKEIRTAMEALGWEYVITCINNERVRVYRRREGESVQ